MCTCSDTYLLCFDPRIRWQHHQAFLPSKRRALLVHRFPSKHDVQSYRTSRRSVRFTTMSLDSSGRLHSSFSCHHHRLPISHVYGFPRSIHPSLMPCSFSRIALFPSPSIVHRDVAPCVSSSTSSSSPCSTMPFSILRVRLPPSHPKETEEVTVARHRRTQPCTTVHNGVQAKPGGTKGLARRRRARGR